MTFEAAGQYLARVVPWDGTHWINICQKMTYPNGGTGIPGLPFLTLNDAVAHLRQKNKNKLDDLYVSMSSAVETETKINHFTKRPFTTALRKRENAYGLKSLFVDLDVKPGAYADTDAALAALSAFCDALALPHPQVVVASGTGGIHAYWVMDQILSTPDWQARADALSAALQEQGMFCDTGCTVDNVRLLRIPDTFNAKRDPHLPVTLLKCEGDDIPLAEIDAALAPFFGRSTVHRITPEGNPGSETDANDELSGGIVPARAALRKAEDVALVCPAFRHTLETAGAADTNPRWHQMLALAYYCEDGEALAHQLSSAHPGYHPEETQVEFERIKKDRDERPSIGWTKCSTLASNGCAECRSCPLLAAGQSPLNHAKPTPVKPTADEFPPPYKRAKDTGFAFRAGAAGDPDELICEYNIFDACVSPAPWRMHFKFSTGGAGTQEVNLPFADAATDQSLRRTLNEQGFVSDSKWLKNFMTSFMTQLQKHKETVASSQAFGWFGEGGEVDSFIYAGQRFTPDGSKRAVKPDETLYEIYTPAGSGDPWRELVQIINAQQRPALDMFIASAFAAPLIRFTGQQGFALGGWSPGSGLGKTTALMAATAVWGHPKRAMSGLSDTENHAMNRMGKIRNLPVMWDEIKSDDEQQKFTKLIFSLTRGMEKGRSRRDGSIAKQGQWETLITYASNASMLDAVVAANRTTTAGAMRMFEVRVPPATVHADPQRIDTLCERLQNNYGLAGRIYAEYLGSNVGKVKEDVQKFQAAVSERVGRMTDERFWVACMSTLILGASYANNLGLTQIDIRGLREFLFAEFERMREQRKDSASDMASAESVGNILANFLQDKRARNTIFTDTMWLTKGRPPKAAVKLLFEGREAERVDVIHVQTAVNPQIIRVSEVGLSEWLQRKGIARTAMLDAIKETLGARRVTGGILGSGTRFALGQASEPLWELPLAGTDLGNLIDWTPPT